MAIAVPVRENRGILRCLMSNNVRSSCKPLVATNPSLHYCKTQMSKISYDSSGTLRSYMLLLVVVVILQKSVF